MTDDTLAKLVIGIVTALFGGLSVAAFNYVAGRRKLEAELDQIKANTEKTFVETSILKNSVNRLSDKISYGEQVVYDGTNGAGFDFKAQGDRFYGEDDSRPIGEGTWKADKGVIEINRTNTDGRYRLRLLSYIYDSQPVDHIPKDTQLSSDRKLRITCEARTNKGTHKLGFALKRFGDGYVFDRTDSELVDGKWRRIVKYVRCDPLAEVQLWIEDVGVSESGSTLLIRKLVLVESLA